MSNPVEDIPYGDRAAMARFMRLRTLDGEQTEWQAYVDWYWSEKVDAVHGPGASAAIEKDVADGSIWGGS